MRGVFAVRARGRRLGLGRLLGGVGTALYLVLAISLFLFLTSCTSAPREVVVDLTPSLASPSEVSDMFRRDCRVSGGELSEEGSCFFPDLGAIARDQAQQAEDASVWLGWLVVLVVLVVVVILALRQTDSPRQPPPPFVSEEP